MQTVIIKKEDYASYQDFYRDILIKLDANGFIDFEGETDLGFCADYLNEFMWYNHRKNLHFIFVGFDLEKINQKKTIDDYKWSLIIEVMNEFAINYPNNKVMFVDKI